MPFIIESPKLVGGGVSVMNKKTTWGGIREIGKTKFYLE